jgi:hypothetical protein
MLGARRVTQLRRGSWGSATVARSAAVSHLGGGGDPAYACGYA